MRRREFIRLLGGAAATPIIWPLAARAQQPEKLRRIGVLNSLARTDAVAHDWDNAFRGRLDELGLIDGRGIQLDYRWGDRSVDRMRMLAGEQTAAFARYYLDAFRAAAAALKIEPIEAPVHSAVEVEAVMTKLGRVGGAGVVVMPETSTGGYGDTIVSLADRCRLPAIYPFSLFVARGGLMSYGVLYPELLRGAASYVDRILKGARPDELPVQLPTKFELIINLKAAKTLGLTVPDKLLALAHKVIE